MLEKYIHRPFELITTLHEYYYAYIKSLAIFDEAELRLIYAHIVQDKPDPIVYEMLRSVSLTFVKPYPFDFKDEHGFIPHPMHNALETDPIELQWQQIPWTGTVCQQEYVDRRVIDYYKRHFLEGHLVKPPIIVNPDLNSPLIIHGTHRTRALWELIFQEKAEPKLPIANAHGLVVAITDNPKDVPVSPQRNLIRDLRIIE